ncbi:hypothetical protein AMELA_G00141830 [Ameiurus melas]|uniref:Secreted protein n=1 Tax=Ameiurus melas TaxID=219545 RepID=A0A7J6ALP3_AMEME|nr:hypothetical protein AMELA_G00141830 [Ameiurus melas]
MPPPCRSVRSALGWKWRRLMGLSCVVTVAACSRTRSSSLTQGNVPSKGVSAQRRTLFELPHKLKEFSASLAKSTSNIRKRASSSERRWPCVSVCLSWCCSCVGLSC